MLAWGPHPTFITTGFKIYRSVSSNPRITNYQLIKTTNNYTFEYKDEDISLSSSGDYIRYYVAAYNGLGTEVPSNQVNTRGGLYKESVAEGEDRLNKYSLNQNHPNPFNPSTTISYQLSEKGYVTLKIYNTLGEEVADLVGETKEAGEYSVDFDASNLPSGVYVYKLTAGEFVESRKMILAK